MFPGTFFTFSLFFLGVLSNAHVQLPSPITHDPVIAHLFLQIYSVTGLVAPTDPVTLNLTRTKILTLLSTVLLPLEDTATAQARQLYCETSQDSPEYMDVVLAMSQIYRRAGQVCSSRSGCETMQPWGSTEIGICGPFGYSWDCKDVGGMAFWIAARCSRDIGVMKVGGRYLFDRWWTGYPAEVRIYRS